MQKISRDIFATRNAIKEPIFYVQATNAIPIEFTFRDWTIPEGAEAKVYVTKPSGKATYDTAEISGNIVTVEVKDQTFAEAGTSNLQIQIAKGEKTLVSFAVPVIVERNNVAGEVPESGNRSNFLEEYMEKMDTAVNDTQKIADSAKDAAEKSKNEATTAKTAATNAEKAAAKANEAAQKVEKVVHIEQRDSAGVATLTGTLDSNMIINSLEGQTRQVATTGAQMLDVHGTFGLVRGGRLVDILNSDTADAIMVYKSEEGSGTAGIWYKAGDYADFVGKTLYLKVENIYKSYTTTDNPCAIVRAVNDAGSTVSTIKTYRYADVGKEIAVTIPDISEANSLIISFHPSDASNQGDVPKDAKGLFLNPMVSLTPNVPYEKYTGGKPAPSPEYPQKIHGIGEKGFFDGLFDIGVISTTTGEIQNTLTYGIYNTHKIECKEGDTISVMTEEAWVAIITLFYDANMKFISATSVDDSSTLTTKVPANAKYMHFNIRSSGNLSLKKNPFVSVTINGQYAIKIKTIGKNLFNPNSENLYIGRINGDTGAHFSNTTVVTTDYIPIRGNMTPKDYNMPDGFSGYGIMYYDENGNYMGGTDKLAYKTAKYARYIRRILAKSNGTSITEAELESIKNTYMLYVGDEPTAYEPYKESEVTIPIDEPLWGDNRLVNQDGKYSVYKQSKSIKYVDIVTSAWRIYQYTNLSAYNNDMTDLAYGEIGYCNYFKYFDSITNKPNGTRGYAVEGVSAGKKGLFFGIEGLVSTIDEWKAWVKKNQPEVVYSLTEGYKGYAPLTDKAQKSVYGLRSFEGTTQVYIEGILQTDIEFDTAGTEKTKYVMDAYTRASSNGGGTGVDFSGTLSADKVEQTTDRNFVSQSEKQKWNAKVDLNVLESGYRKLTDHRTTFAQIPNNTDIDTVTDNGYYVAGGNANVDTMSNTPFGSDSFTLLVLDSIITGNANHIQIAFRYDRSSTGAPSIALRQLYKNNKWSTWESVYTSSSKPTKADVGLGNVDNLSADKIKQLQLPDGTDLNNIKEGGFYVCGGDVQVKTMKNTPFDTYSFAMSVYKTVLASGGFVVQVAFCYAVNTKATTKTIAIRKYSSNTGEGWDNWRYVYDSVNKPTKADIGLGNVVNAAPNDMQVSFARSNDYEALVSNQTLQANMGRIAGAINTLRGIGVDRMIRIPKSVITASCSYNDGVVTSMFSVDLVTMFYLVRGDYADWRQAFMIESAVLNYATGDEMGAQVPLSPNGVRTYGNSKSGYGAILTLIPYGYLNVQLEVASYNDTNCTNFKNYVQSMYIRVKDIRNTVFIEPALG